MAAASSKGEVLAQAADPQLLLRAAVALRGRAHQLRAQAAIA
jgi:hypothetical protein